MKVNMILIVFLSGLLCINLSCTKKSESNVTVEHCWKCVTRDNTTNDIVIGNSVCGIEKDRDAWINKNTSSQVTTTCEFLY